MTPREGFRFGFLYRCAEEGLTAPEALDRARLGLEKRADPLWFKALSGLGSGLGGLATGGAKALGGAALLAGVGVPTAIGGGIGLGLAKAQEGDIDPEEIRNRELIAALHFHAEQARRRTAMKRFQLAGPGK